MVNFDGYAKYDQTRYLLEDAFDGSIVTNDPYTFRHNEALSDQIRYMDPNEFNYFSQERSNYLNMLQTQNTNAWNKYLWDLQNAYDAPQAQMERYLQAGINPIWAMSKASSSGSPAVSAQPIPNVAPQMSFEGQAQANDMLKFAQSNALNSMLGFGELDVKNRNLAIQDRLSHSTIKKTLAEIEVLKTQVENNEFVNKVNSATYGAQVNQKIADLNLTNATIKNLESQSDLSAEQKKLLEVSKEKVELEKNQVIAMTKKVEQDILNDLVRLQFEAQRIAIEQQNADAASTQAAAAYMNAQTNDAALNHQIEKDTKEFELKTNDQILEMLDRTRSVFDRMLGNPGNTLEHTFGADGSLLYKQLNYVRTGVKVLYNRFYSNPTKANAKAIDDCNKLIQNLQSSLQSYPIPMPLNSPSTSSVENPSSSWSNP